MYNGIKFKTPFFSVNPKAYIYGREVVELAKTADVISEKYGVDIFFTAQFVDIPSIVGSTKRLHVSAQHMDSIMPGRGMGYILPEALKEAGVEAVTLNHAEHPLTLSQLAKAIRRADEVGLITFVCADTVEDAKAIATLSPNIIVCEQTGLIGTGNISNSAYIDSTISCIKQINSDIKVAEAAGISTGSDVYKVIFHGADGTGASSGIINSKDRAGIIEEMVSSLCQAYSERGKHKPL
jgi:Triosephosphate isomerase